MNDPHKEKKYTKKMNVKFKSEDEYRKFSNGEIHSQKGLRSKDGKLRTQPDIEEIDAFDDFVNDFEYEGDYYLEEDKSEINDIINEVLSEIVISLIKIAGEKVTEILNDKEKREIIFEAGKIYLKNKVIPSAKNSWERTVYKAKKSMYMLKELLNKESNNSLEKTVECKSYHIIDSRNDSSYYNEKQVISRKEAEEQFYQIGVLALMLKEKINSLSNSIILENDRYIQDTASNNKILDMSEPESLKTIEFLLENKSYFLDESTARILSEFVKGNIIYNNKVISIREISRVKM